MWFYDSEGKILQATVVEDSKGIERTVIENDGKEVFKALELRMLLIDYLEYYYKHKRCELEEMELSEIVRESLDYKIEFNSLGDDLVGWLGRLVDKCVYRLRKMFGNES